MGASAKLSFPLHELHGEYALVTGASEGLGRAYAEAFARHGLHVILVAREEERLRDIARDLEARFSIRTTACPLDLSQPATPELLQTKIRELGITIALLCNNVGTGYLGRFGDCPLAESMAMVQLNCATMAALCRLFTEDLASHRHSAIINVASVAGLQPMPNMALYAASKAFVLTFSQALHWELRERGVYVQTMVPAAIDTSFNRKMGLKTRTRRPDEVVACSLRALERGAVVAASNRGVWLQKLFAALAPPEVVLRTTAKLFAS